jgi:hypothetical protein
MQDGFGTSGFILPPSRVGNALSELNQNLMFRRQMEQRRMEKAQEDEWKKANLIGDLTDLSKHQTSSDVANAIGNEQARSVVQKFSALAKTLSPIELQGKINQEMSAIHNGMGGVKAELEQSENMIKTMKQSFPDLDYTSLAKDARADVLNRRVTGNGFVNPMEVKPSEMNIGDPEFLSRYATGNKNLVDEIITPKGAETEVVLMGKKGDYSKIEGKLPYFKTPSYRRDKDFDDEGFYKGKELPSFKIKGHAIPSSTIPSSANNPMMVVDDDVYERFAQNQKSNIELVRATREVYKGYDNFNATDKELAKKNVLYKLIETFDQSQPQQTFSTKPPRITVNTGGSKTKSEEQIISEMGHEFDRIGGGKRVEFNSGDFIEGGVFKTKDGGNYSGKKTIDMKYVPASMKAALKGAGMDITEKLADERANIKVPTQFIDAEIEDGKIVAIAVGKDRVDRQDMINAQLKYNTEPAKGAQLKFGSKAQSSPTEKTFSIKGKTYTMKQIEAAAKASEMSVEEYMKEVGIK